MTEPTPGEGSALPTPTFFDPAFERLPGGAAFNPERDGPVLLVFDRAADRDWVADAAIAIATGWHGQGRRTVLADLSLDDPMLAERIGMSSMEGVVDVFLYGASLARSARAVPGRGFYLISAGTYTPDTSAILRHSRWEKLAHGFRETGASLLLFVPSDAPGLAVLARAVTDAIVLADRAHASDVELGIPDFVRVHAFLTPPQAPGSGAPAAAAASPPGSPFPEPAAGAGFRPWEAPAGSRPPPVKQEFRSAEATVGAPAASLPVPEPDWQDAPPEAPPARRGVSPLLLGLLVVALLGAAVYAASQLRPEWFGRAPVSAVAPVAAPPAPRPAPGPDTAAGVQLPYAVWVNGYPGLEAAQRRADEVSRAIPDSRFYITVETASGQPQGSPYYKVLSGVLADSAEAAALRARLLQRRLIDPADVGTEAQLITVRPWALELGEFPSQEAAEARVDSLAARAIPTYAVPVPYSSGVERWRVYGGAFEDSAAAQPMMRMLEQASVPGRLVRRTGRPPAAPK